MQKNKLVTSDQIFLLEKIYYMHIFYVIPIPVQYKSLQKSKVWCMVTVNIIESIFEMIKR